MELQRFCPAYLTTPLQPHYHHRCPYHARSSPVRSSPAGRSYLHVRDLLTQKPSLGGSLHVTIPFTVFLKSVA